MTDHISEDRLQDLLDERLSAAERHTIEEHLSACGACADRWAAWVELRDRASRAPRGITPPADWWPEIRAAIEQRKIVPMGGGGAGSPRPWWTRPIPAIAAAAVLIVLTAALTTWLTRQSSPPAPVTAGAMAIQVTEYERTVGTLLGQFEAQWRRLPPAAQVEVARNLMVVDSAIREIRTVLQEEPGNETLLGVLLASYRQKVALMEHVTQAAS